MTARCCNARKRIGTSRSTSTSSPCTAPYGPSCPPWWRRGAARSSTCRRRCRRSAACPTAMSMGPPRRRPPISSARASGRMRSAPAPSIRLRSTAASRRRPRRPKNRQQRCARLLSTVSPWDGSARPRRWRRSRFSSPRTSRATSPAMRIWWMGGWRCEWGYAASDLDWQRFFTSSVLIRIVSGLATSAQQRLVDPPADFFQLFRLQRAGDRAGEIVVFPHQRGQAIARDASDRSFLRARPSLEVECNRLVGGAAHDELHRAPLRQRNDPRADDLVAGAARVAQFRPDSERARHPARELAQRRCREWFHAGTIENEMSRRRLMRQTLHVGIVDSLAPEPARNGPNREDQRRRNSMAPRDRGAGPP